MGGVKNPAWSHGVRTFSLKITEEVNAVLFITLETLRFICSN